MHRFTFHHAPLFKTGHGEHHKQPKLPIGTPFFITLPGYLLIAWGVAALIGYGTTSALLSGFIVGYYGYIICHHVLHNNRIQPGSYWYPLEKIPRLASLQARSELRCQLDHLGSRVWDILPTIIKNDLQPSVPVSPIIVAVNHGDWQSYSHRHHCAVSAPSATHDRNPVKSTMRFAIRANTVKMP